MKIVLTFLAATTVVLANPAPILGGYGAVVPQLFSSAPANSQLFQALLERDVQQLVSNPNFPEDLRQQADNLLVNSAAQFKECEAQVLIYLQRICNAKTYAAARNVLNTIAQEAEARKNAENQTGLEAQAT